MKIQDVASQTGLSIHALRYYEQIGLVTPVNRERNGHRAYSEDDVYRILFVMHLRSAGMPIADIKRYVELSTQGENTVDERLEILEDHQRAVEANIEELCTHLEVIRKKIAHYREFHARRLAQEG